MGGIAELRMEGRKVPPFEAVVVGPNDRVLLVFPAGLTEEDLQYFRSIIADEWQKRVLLVSGVEQVAILKGE